MKYVTCVTTDKKHLTRGHDYLVNKVSETGNLYKVMDDSGNDRYYHKRNFTDSEVI